MSTTVTVLIRHLLDIVSTNEYLSREKGPGLTSKETFDKISSEKAKFHCS